MGFDLYFTSVPAKSDMGDFIIENDACLLLSQLNERQNIYNWIEKIKTHPNSKCKLFIDSGAFSAWTLGKQIDVDEYINFINNYKDYFEICASVDSIPGTPKVNVDPTPIEIEESARCSWDNFLYMRDKMLDKNKLLYTFHFGEKWEHLKEALDYQDNFGKLNYIALGGLVGKGANNTFEFLKMAEKVIFDSSNPNIKVHIFGMTRLDYLENFRFYSADSTGWVLAGAFGTIFVNGKKVCVSSTQANNDNNIINKGSALYSDIVKIVSDRGFTLEELQTSRDKRVLFNLIDSFIWSQNYNTPSISNASLVNLW